MIHPVLECLLGDSYSSHRLQGFSSLPRWGRHRVHEVESVADHVGQLFGPAAGRTSGASVVHRCFDLLVAVWSGAGAPDSDLRRVLEQGLGVRYIGETRDGIFSG